MIGAGLIDGLIIHIVTGDGLDGPIVHLFEGPHGEVAGVLRSCLVEPFIRNPELAGPETPVRILHLNDVDLEALFSDGDSFLIQEFHIASAGRELDLAGRPVVSHLRPFGIGNCLKAIFDQIDLLLRLGVRRGSEGEKENR